MGRGANDVSIVFRLLGKDSGFKQMMSEAQLASATTAQKMQYHMAKVGKSMSNVGRTMSVGVTLPIVAGMTLAVKSASDLEESLNAVSVTFGKAAKGINKLGKEAATSVGLSAKQFNDLAVQFSSFAKIVAGPGGDVVKQMDELTTRAADFASVMNLDVQEAARLFQSGLAGESEPLRKYGIDVSAAAVNAFAYAKGIAKHGQQLTEAQKVQARYGLIMKATAKNAGDFANTSDGLANRSRILKATLGNLSAELGSVLLPVITSVASKVGGLVGWVSKLSPEWKRVAVVAAIVVGAVGPLLAIFGPIVTVIGALIPVVATVISMIGALGAAFAAGGLPALGGAMLAALGPVGLVIIAVTAVIAIIVLLWTKCSWFRDFWIAVWDEVKVVFEAVWPVITKVFGWIVDGFTINYRITKDLVLGFWNWAGPFITEAVKVWWRIIKQVVGWIYDKFVEYWPLIKGIVKTNIDAIKGIIDGVKTVVGVIGRVWSAIHTAASTAWGIATGIAGVVKTGLTTIKNLPGEFLERIKNAVADIWTAIDTKARSAWGAITGVVKGAWNNIAGFVNKILGAFNWVTQHVPGMTHTDYQLPTFSGDDSRSAADVGKTIVPGLLPRTGDDSRGPSGDFSLSSLNPLGLLDNIPWPNAPDSGGLFGGIGGALLTAVKDAVKEMVKKALGSIFGGTGGGTAPVGGAGYAWAYALAQKFGLFVSSTFRPGAITAAGNISDHGTYGRAADIAGAVSSMGALWNYVKATAGSWKQAIYGHQMLNYGSLGYYGPSDHFDHVHLARAMGLGGITRGLSIAGEAGPEAVIPLTNAKRGAAVMREAGLVSGGDTYVSFNINRVYATSPAQAEAAGTKMMNAAIAKLATAKRQTARGTP